MKGFASCRDLNEVILSCVLQEIPMQLLNSEQCTCKVKEHECFFVLESVVDFPVASEVQDLKKLSGLAVLRALGRKRYHLISSLPLPSHLIQLISHNRDWGSPPQPVKILCPIDRNEGEREGEGNEEGGEASRPRLGRRRRGRGADRDREYSAMIAPSIVNGRRVLFVNMEGLFMPVSPAAQWLTGGVA